MPRLNLTEKAIHKMKAPDPSGKQVIHFDGTLRGFGVQCSGISTAKTFIAQADHAGKTRRVKVGAVNELTLIDARQIAAGILIDLRKGITPGSKPDSNITLRTTLQNYLQARRDLRPASVRGL
jgi:hypothetical protein